MVTGDALHYEKANMQPVVENGGDFFFQLNGNLAVLRCALIALKSRHASHLSWPAIFERSATSTSLPYKPDLQQSPQMKKPWPHRILMTHFLNGYGQGGSGLGSLEQAGF
jgi:hypothetical protein